MIASLSISNYALIRDIDVQFAPGLNIITGETGAGKSIILAALSLLQGRRAESKAVTADRKSVVEARFELSSEMAGQIAPILAEAEVEPLDGYCILRREISPTGRSRALINDSPVTLTTMEQISERLVDIHSQHKNLLIGKPEFQRQVLDILAGNAELLDNYHKIYADYRLALRKFADTRDEIERTRSDADYLLYQHNELEAMNLVAGEDAELEARREVLATSSDTSTHLAEAAEAMSLGDQNASTLTKRALEALRELAATSPSYEQLAERLESLHVELDDIADTLAEQASAMRDDPEELDHIDRRINRINALKTKHKAETVDQLIEMQNRISLRLATLADADSVLGELERHARSLKKQAMEAATTISGRRCEAARNLEQALRQRATPLGLPNLVCNFAVTPGKLNSEGCDTVEYLFGFNKNQTPLPIGQTASGGEISRVMLALKSILAEHVNLPTIIFDEIDTGVSGDVANRMGQLMAAIGNRLQVIAITHLPQVAACGSAHFKVFKHDNDESTETQIVSLPDSERRRELALMLSGNPDDPTALATADMLIAQHSKS